MSAGTEIHPVSEPEAWFGAPELHAHGVGWWDVTLGGNPAPAPHAHRFLLLEPLKNILTCPLLFSLPVLGLRRSALSLEIFQETWGTQHIVCAQLRFTRATQEGYQLEHRGQT